MTLTFDKEIIRLMNLRLTLSKNPVADSRSLIKEMAAAVGDAVGVLHAKEPDSRELENHIYELESTMFLRACTRQVRERSGGRENG